MVQSQKNHYKINFYGIDGFFINGIDEILLEKFQIQLLALGSENCEVQFNKFDLT
jgi:hypothetical protein